ncbi:DUF1203 domain-containing protein [Lysobacter humi (ex Lee et al. 2017)]
MAYRIRGLDPAPFRHLYGLDDAALATHGARRVRVDRAPGVPDRIELRDLAPGETALLVNHVHQPAPTPYRASHAVYVREGADAAVEAVDIVPEVLRRRRLSLRAFDAMHMMVDGRLVDGLQLHETLPAMLAATEVAYVHVHFAAHGCYAALAERA